MKKTLKYLTAGLVLCAGTAVAFEARADETVVICSETLAYPPAAATCAATALLWHEAFAERPFGPNGEIMKVLAAPVKIIDGNVKGAERESGEIAKVLRGTLGISVRDINAYGIWGGANSIFRKPFG